MLSYDCRLSFKMTETPSKTSNHQRLDEMLIHLTPVGAVIPYSLCYDSNGHIWVATKGGIFKFSGAKGEPPLFERKNMFPKKIAPYCQVLAVSDKIIHVQTDDKSALTEFRLLSLDGEIQHEQFIDGKIQSLAVSSNGDVFMTKQPNSDESVIYKTSIDALLGWDEFCSSFDYSFQNLCVLDDDTLFVATTSIPINMYSKQNLHLIDTNNGNIKKTFSSAGKEQGQIYFPRSIQVFNGDALVLDKTGRIQRFNKNGEFVEQSAAIDSYLGNGFVVRNDQAIIACSGIVLDKEGKTICDDWLETINLDGSTWKSD
ncbi:hypothetical protein M3Y97_00060100 [Aphelenchoides bicaudatus]|nr:hypothetical protein M3Y97_00060100 [Aphelenchoides bicaudatus]